jgi:hypothetical protein
LPLFLKASSSALSVGSSTGVIRLPLSSAALLLSNSAFSSAFNGTLVSSNSFRLGIPGPNSGLSIVADSSPFSLFSVADRLPYQYVKAPKPTNNSTPKVTLTPIPAFAPLDRPPDFDVAELAEDEDVCVPVPENDGAGVVENDEELLGLELVLVEEGVELDWVGVGMLLVRDAEYEEHRLSPTCSAMFNSVALQELIKHSKPTDAMTDCPVPHLQATSVAAQPATEIAETRHDA